MQRGVDVDLVASDRGDVAEGYLDRVLVRVEGCLGAAIDGGNRKRGEERGESGSVRVAFFFVSLLGVVCLGRPCRIFWSGTVSMWKR